MPIHLHHRPSSLAEAQEPGTGRDLRTTNTVADRFGLSGNRQHLFAMGLGTLLLPVLTVPALAVPLTVRVIDAQTETPVAGAFVMVGESENVPFVGNVAFTNGAGEVSFDDPALANPQTVTVGADEYSLTTLYRSASDEVTLRLFARTLDPGFGGLLTEVSGDVDNVETISNDGNIDVSVVLPGVTTETLAFFDPSPFLFELELVNFPIVGDVLLPENVYITRQTEVIFLIFEKAPYTIDVPGNRSTSFAAVSARAALSELSSDPDLSALEIREFGVERNVALGTGSQIVDVNSDIDLDPDGITTNFSGVPTGANLRIVSAALIGSGPEEEILGFATITPNISEGATWSVAATNPVGDISDADIVVSGVYQDSSSAGSFAAGILQRGPLTVPTNVTFDSWLLLPSLSHSGTTLEWEDPTDSGVSPSPTWTRSTLGLVPVDPSDGSVTPTIDWRIYAPAALGSIDLPVLPASAPAGLPDPEETPENDQIAWSFTAANGSNDPQHVVDNFMTGATHWTQGWIPVDLETTNAPLPGTAQIGSDIGMRVSPSPTAGEVRIDWRAQEESSFDLSVVSSDGRAVRALDSAPGAAYAVWDGRDARGQDAPTGVYWVVARSQGEVVGRQQVVRIR